MKAVYCFNLLQLSHATSDIIFNLLNGPGWLSC